MSPSLLVLANLPEAAAPTARYAAALSQPLGLRLALLHCYLHPALLTPALAQEEIAQTDYNEAETMTALHALARRLPVPTEVLEAGEVLKDDVAAAIRRYQPLLLALGLGPDQSLLDALLHTHVLPVLRATGRPVLLVPAAATAAAPRRVLVAVDSEPFGLTAASRNLGWLLGSWAATYTVAHIDLSGELPGTEGQRALADVRASKLLPPATPVELYEVADVAPAAGILQALADTQADMLVLIARPRSFFGALFHRSVTAAVLRHTWVPVLLLPTAG
ncbi:hypothetical protein A0257_23010 (plasmid) [Hymenobacter psoromatis]|nr:hypothetical protein A0257_23010 [Hymenobacter psoromatis]